jgi:uncharacterized protein YgfB (UPF0149 family)
MDALWDCPEDTVNAPSLPAALAPGYDTGHAHRGRAPDPAMQDTYTELDRSLVAIASGVEASEAHGCLCGALCAEDAFPATEWAAEMLPDEAGEAAATALVGLLSGIRDETLRTLAGEDLDFQPLLPDDDRPLDERVRALAAWCSGYLYGLGRSGLLDQLPGDLGEILQDFSEISRATLAAGEAGEKAERDYAELVEFVRASVQLAYEELAPQRRRFAAARGHEH